MYIQIFFANVQRCSKRPEANYRSSKNALRRIFVCIVKLIWQAEKRFKVGDKVGVDPNRQTSRFSN